MTEDTGRATLAKVYDAVQDLKVELEPIKKLPTIVDRLDDRLRKVENQTAQQWIIVSIVIAALGTLLGAVLTKGI